MKLDRTRIASMIAAKEGKLSEVSIGDIREILKVLIHLDAEAVLSNILPSPLHVLENDADALVEKMLERVKCSAAPKVVSAAGAKRTSRKKKSNK